MHTFFHHFLVPNIEVGYNFTFRMILKDKLKKPQVFIILFAYVNLPKGLIF